MPLGATTRGDASCYVASDATPANLWLHALQPYRRAVTFSVVNVSFKRTGVRQYAVTVHVPGQPIRAADPAPGFDEDIPHDLVHYVVEAELGLANGVYGRAARGAGTFIATTERDMSARERSRQQRRQRRRERSLQQNNGRATTDMTTSEHVAALSDVAWRRKAGQKPDAQRTPPVLREEDRKSVERVVARLDALAPLWRVLPVGGELVFAWPSAQPIQRSDAA